MAWDLICDPCRFLWFLFLILVANQVLSVAVKHLIYAKLDLGVRGFMREYMPVVFDGI